MKKLLLALLLVAQSAYAGLVLTTTTTYNGADVANYPVTQALLNPGVYTFSLVAKSTATGAVFSGLSVYLQQQGPSGAYYTLNNSTFTTCSANCNVLVNPDVYEGGIIRPQWSVTTGSVTFTITAFQVTP